MQHHLQLLPVLQRPSTSPSIVSSLPRTCTSYIYKMVQGMQSLSNLSYILMTVLLSSVHSFISTSSLNSGSTRSSISMAASNTVVIGVAGGVAECVACRLLESSGDGSISAVFDRKPFSPILLEAAKSKKLQIFSADFDKDQLLDITDERIKSFSEILSGKVVVAVNDEGDDFLRGGQEKNNKGESAQMLTRLLKALPSSVKSLVCATSAESDKADGGTFQ